MIRSAHCSPRAHCHPECSEGSLLMDSEGSLAALGMTESRPPSSRPTPEGPRGETYLHAPWPRHGRRSLDFARDDGVAGGWGASAGNCSACTRSRALARAREEWASVQMG